MNWAAPLWLWTLLPWLAAVLYLLWGRRPRVDVPFLDLWPSSGDDAVRVRRRATPPPIALALAILGTLLALLAAGRPGIRSTHVDAVRVLDCGYTMSARGQGGTRLEQVMPEASFISDMRVIPVGDTALSATALDTRAALSAAIRRTLLEHETEHVVVLSDQETGVTDDRIIQIAPPQPIRNARIVFASAREFPAPQIMVRLRSDGTLPRAMLRVSSGAQRVEREILLPSGEHDEFIDMPRLGETIRTELEADDDQPADNSVWLVRQASWPRIEPRLPLSPELQRMIGVYQRERPSTQSSSTLVIVSAVTDLPNDRPGVVLPDDVAEMTAISGMQMKDHPLTKDLTWRDLGATRLARVGPPAGWTPIVTVGNETWVAVRDMPARGVWIGFDTRAWATSPEFVVFWASVLNWAGAGAEQFASDAVGAKLEGQWTAVELAKSIAPPAPMFWPGLYRRSDGVMRALHAPDVPIPTPIASDWHKRLTQLRQNGFAQIAFAPWLCCLALLCIVGSALLWKRGETQQT